MTVGRLFAIVLIFSCVAVAWAILGTSVSERTNAGYRELGSQVTELWGGEHVQEAPRVVARRASGAREDLELNSSDVAVKLHLDQRRKGLLWYSTYEVFFDGRYTVQNTFDEPVTAIVSLDFPTSGAMYDDFQFAVGEQSVRPRGGDTQALKASVELGAGEGTDIRLTYRSRGMDRWRYRFARSITTVSNFHLAVDTDFDAYDFPPRTISASSKTRTPEGWHLEWDFSSLVSDAELGVEMPHPLNPGVLASRMSYFAPVSLLFFFTVLVVLSAMRHVNLHPMHYFFMGAGFFAFHLLFAYLADHLAVEVAFVASTIVSLGLVISYLGRVTGWRFALREAGLSQFLFLVLFSYAFFYEGYTGLVITVGAIITLAALMHITAGVDWADAFRGKDRHSAPNLSATSADAGESAGGG